MKQRYQVAVLGLGAIGAATLMHLAEAGVKVLGLDQFSPPHNFGSSHGETRITRQAIGEGEAYIPFVQRAQALWQKLEARTKQQVFHRVGGLLLDPDGQTWTKYGKSGFAERTISLAQQHGIPHEVLSGADLQARFPQFNLGENGQAYYEPNAGFLKPERAIEIQLNLAEAAGATIWRGVKLEDLTPIAGGGVQIQTTAGRIEADRAVLALGAWIRPFLPDALAARLKVCRQVLHWVPISEACYTTMPTFMWGFGANPEDFLYGFPSLDGQTIKIASESYLEAGEPDGISREVSKAEQAAFMMEKVGDRLRFLTGSPVKSAVCLYTVAPNANFILDEHPHCPEVVLASCCSGHGFKHALAIGEALADEVRGQQSHLSLAPFRI